MGFGLQFFLVFLSLIAVDICWTFYIANVNAKHAVKASIWSASIMLCGAFATISYVHDKRLLAAAILGALVGTFAAVKISGKDK